MAEDLAQMGLSLGPGLASALLMMECCQMSRTVYTCPKPLRVSAPSFTSLEAAEYRLLMVESKTYTLSLLLARDWLTALKILSLVSRSTESP